MPQDYPPRNLDREADVSVSAPRGVRVESYSRPGDSGPTGQAIWLLTPRGRFYLEPPPLFAENPFMLDRFAVAPNLDFVFGSRKVATGENQLFLWVRQKNGSYKRLPETMNDWIVRRGKATRGPIDLVGVVKWLDNGSGVTFGALYRDRGHNYWHTQEVDLVHGKFAPPRIVSQSKLKFLI